jgi:hypothetical protein
MRYFLIFFSIAFMTRMASGLELFPPQPTSCDSLMLRISRLFASDCGWSVTPEIKRDGSAVAVLLHLSGNPICLPVAREKTFEVLLGSFPEGAYVLNVQWSDLVGVAPPQALALVVNPGTSCLTGFRRADANGDGNFDVSDAIAILSHLFLGGSLDCKEAADADGNARMELTDAIYLLTHLFLGGNPPPAPYPQCGRVSETGPVFGCEKPSCDPGGPGGQALWMFLPDGCMQCEPCNALSLKEMVQNLIATGIDVLEFKEGGTIVCEACSVCPSGRVYLVLVNPRDAEFLKGIGWRTADPNFIVGL